MRVADVTDGLANHRAHRRLIEGLEAAVGQPRSAGALGRVKVFTVLPSCL